MIRRDPRVGMSAACQRRVLSGRAVKFGCHLLAFLVPAVLATNYTINVFYTLGAAMLDSGWFAHLACHGLANPPALGGTFLADHMSAVLALLALVHTISPTMPDPVFFAISQGFWFGVLGLTASLCVAQWLPAGRGLLLALLCAMNGISLATLGFPHIEIAIPALILLVLALLTTGRHVAAFILVPLLLTVREDAGLHLAIILVLMAAFRWYRTGQWRMARIEAVLAALCAIMSLFTLVLQAILFGDGAFSTDGLDSLHAAYLGRSALAHVDWPFLVHRVLRLGQNRSYIYLPFLITSLVAVKQGNLGLALGPLSGMPWVALALIAVSPQAGELTNYYSFPLMIGLCWPMIACQPGFGSIDPRLGVRLLAANVGLSILLFSVSGGHHDRRPWLSFGPPDFARVAATEEALDEILNHRGQLGHFIVDDAVGSLRPSAFSPSELRMMMEYSDAEVAATNAMIFQKVRWLDAKKRAIIASADLKVHYRVRGTLLLLYSRTNLEGLSVLARADHDDTSDLNAAVP
jgi:hypothetical protein